MTRANKATDKKASDEKAGKERQRSALASKSDLPFAESVGYQVRATHRALQRFLQFKIEPHGITLGMWYFLRVLWLRDGITQSELSRRTGTMEPTTLAAVRDMERAGIVRRVRDPSDGRKINVYLTDHGRGLEPLLMPLAAEVVQSAVSGLTDREVTMLLGLLAAMQRNLQD